MSAPLSPECPSSRRGGLQKTINCAASTAVTSKSLWLGGFFAYPIAPEKRFDSASRSAETRLESLSGPVSGWNASRISLVPTRSSGYPAPLAFAALRVDLKLFEDLEDGDVVVAEPKYRDDLSLEFDRHQITRNDAPFDVRVDVCSSLER
jgi:hypothetical protein